MYNYDGTWTSADGQTKKITELSDRHLQNIIKYMERNAEAIAFHDQWALVEFASQASEASQDAWGSLDPANELIEEHYQIYDVTDVDEPDDVKREIASTQTDLEWVRRYYEPYQVIKEELDKRTK